MLLAFLLVQCFGASLNCDLYCYFSSLLPDRKLKTLVQRPLDNLPETKDGYSLLLFWYYEECLKQRYFQHLFLSFYAAIKFLYFSPLKKKSKFRELIF